LKLFNFIHFFIYGIALALFNSEKEAFLRPSFLIEKKKNDAEA